MDRTIQERIRSLKAQGGEEALREIYDVLVHRQNVEPRTAWREALGVGPRDALVIWAPRRKVHLVRRGPVDSFSRAVLTRCGIYVFRTMAWREAENLCLRCRNTVPDRRPEGPVDDQVRWDLVQDEQARALGVLGPNGLFGDL